MNFRTKTIVALFLLGLLFLGSAGCWNRREPEALASILALGLDYDASSGEYLVMVEIATPGALSGQGGGDSGGGGGGGMRPSQVLSARGRTVIEALRHIEATVPRELFWAHTEIVVISETLARQGLQPVLDFFSRERQSRLIITPIITDSDVQELLDAETPLEQLSGEALLSQIETIGRADAVVPQADLRTLLMYLTEPGIDPFLPRGRLVKGKQGGQQQGGQQPQQQQGQQQGGGGGSRSIDTIELNGGAAFRGDRMAGWLNNSATRGWFWITGEAFRGTVFCPCPGGDGYVSVELFQSFSRIQPVVAGGRPRVKVEITVEGRLQDATCMEPFLAGKDAGVVLDKLLAGAVRDDVYAALGRARELGSDIFGFGRTFYRSMPQQWSRFAADWEEIFKTLEVELIVKARVRRTGLTIELLRQVR